MVDFGRPNLDGPTTNYLDVFSQAQTHSTVGCRRRGVQQPTLTGMNRQLGDFE